MDLLLVQNVVDQALASASHKVLMDLPGGYKGRARAQKLASAAQELYDALRVCGQVSTEPDLRMPNYQDPWVALAYTQWYQLRQIHLAYSLTRDLLDNETIRCAPGHEVHDVGCGALAFAIGLALAVAERLEDEDSVGPFEFYGYDYASLRTVGRQHWNMLRQTAGSDERLYRLAEAMNLIRLNLHDFSAGSVIRHFTERSEAYRWLVAQHTAYEVNQNEVRNDLAEWFASVQPHIGLVTGPSFKNRVVNHINPFGMLPSCQSVGVISWLGGVASAITSHRAEIAGNHAVPSSNLLCENVSWNHYSGNGAPYALRYLRLPER